MEAAGEEADKVGIARAILRENRSRLDVSNASRSIPIAAWVTKEAADRALAEILDWVPVKRPFDPERPPRLAGLIGLDRRGEGRPPDNWVREDEQDAIA